MQRTCIYTRHIAPVGIAYLSAASETSETGQWRRTTRYNTIRYDTIYSRALESWRYGQLGLAHGKETKKIRKNWQQKPSNSEETVRAKFPEGSQDARIWRNITRKEPLPAVIIVKPVFYVTSSDILRFRSPRRCITDAGTEISYAHLNWRMFWFREKNDHQRDKNR